MRVVRLDEIVFIGSATEKPISQYSWAGEWPAYSHPAFFESHLRNCRWGMIYVEIIFRGVAVEYRVRKFHKRNKIWYGEGHLIKNAINSWRACRGDSAAPMEKVAEEGDEGKLWWMKWYLGGTRHLYLANQNTAQFTNFLNSLLTGLYWVVCHMVVCGKELDLRRGTGLYRAC